jgi:cytosine/adenosine deaminase-related metal-dependent hydrolase
LGWYLEKGMTLAGARVAVNACDSIQTNIWIQGSRIRGLHTEKPRAPVLDLTGFLILPGLINAHDHLEFNLFPRLGRGPYANATEWAKEIYQPCKSPVRQHLQVPKAVRLLWGGIKNLLSGVTTVSHHNPYQASVFNRRFPVRVVKRFGWAHSLRFSADAEERFRRTPRDAPFIIHAGEGCDIGARNEIVQLDQCGMLTPSTVIVHGVAFERDEDLHLIAERGSSLIWCPTSNYFTIGKTLSPEVFEAGIPIALGTDSALTAKGDLVDEIQAGHKYLPVGKLFEMVTKQAARILRLTSGEGSIQENGIADLLVVTDDQQTPAESLLNLHPELIIVNGRVKLFSSRIADRLNLWGAPSFQPIEVEDRGRSFIAADVLTLLEVAKRDLGEECRLAGKRVSSWRQ